MINMLIVGHGFVGKAVDYGFEHPDVNKVILDPKYGRDLSSVNISSFDIAFVCVPTPMGNGGHVDDAILESVMDTLIKHDLTIVIKSTIPPSVIDKYDDPKVVYNPEFLTEKSANEQFINPQFHVLGGEPDACSYVDYCFNTYSNVVPAPVLCMTRTEASFVKYTINSFLAMKVTFFNQLYDAVQDTDANFSIIANAVGQDSRIGYSHTRVPGFDGKQGFGGACFPKDTNAFVNYSHRLTLLEECIRINNAYRLRYELDEREKEQKIHYG